MLLLHFLENLYLFVIFVVSSQKFGVGARLALAQLDDRKGAPLHFEMILFVHKKQKVFKIRENLFNL